MAANVQDKIEVVQGDITTLEVDAVVNAANGSLMGGGGVDGAIHKAGGPAILAECKQIREKEYPDGLPAGEAVITTAGDMPARFIIHTVGPVWYGGGKKEDQTLESAYRNSLRRAVENNLKTVAFPAISTGIYGFPKERAAKIAYGVINDFLKKEPSLEKVYLVFFSRGDMDRFLRSSGM